jgi:ABC-2 type transport system permease protein
MIKISRRPSVIIVAAAVFLIALAFPFLLKIIYNDDSYLESMGDLRHRTEESLNEAKSELSNSGLKTTNQTVTIEVDGKERSVQMTLYTGSEIVNNLANKILYEDMLKDFNFDKYPVTMNWLTIKTMQNYRESIQSIISLDMTAFEERDAEWLKEYEKLTEARTIFRKALMEHDYASLCKGLELQDNDQTYVSMVRMLASSDPKGELSYTEGSYLMEYLNKKNEKQELLDSGLETQMSLPRVLTEERKEILQNGIKILDYKFENRNLYNEKSMISMMVSYYTSSVVRYGLIVLLVLIAGSSVSQELATGSIKSLIIAPVKRWKIYTAKLMSIITWMLVSSVLLTLITNLSTGLAFGFDNMPSYLYVSGGQVTEMPFMLAMILIDLVQNIPTFFYAFIGFMISCFTKNTGVSVGVSIGMLLFHNVPELLLESDMPHRFLDFTPLANMNLVNKVFPYLDLMVATEDVEFNLFATTDFNNPLWSMVLYIAVLTFTILLIAFEEFTKKDIA